MLLNGQAGGVNRARGPWSALLSLLRAGAAVQMGWQEA